MKKEIYLKSPMNYTGGKYKLLPQILPLFPQNIGTFVDLFTGGANVAINVEAGKIVANDFEKHLIDIYDFIKGYKCSRSLVEQINILINEYDLSKTNEEGFKELRDFYNQKVNKNKEYEDISPLYLFVLICYSFNHQIRFNSKGEFNMPFGKNRSQWNNNIEKNLVKFHNALKEKDIIFTNKDFRELKIDKLKENDFVYCDPPYLITCATYNEKDGWNEKCERDLLDLLDKLDSKGVKFALSNILSDNEKTNDLLVEWSRKYNVHHLDYGYQNCNYHKKDKNTKADEVLITNYK